MESILGFIRFTAFRKSLGWSLRYARTLLSFERGATLRHSSQLPQWSDTNLLNSFTTALSSEDQLARYSLRAPSKSPRTRRFAKNPSPCLAEPNLCSPK